MRETSEQTAASDSSGGGGGGGGGGGWWGSMFSAASAAVKQAESIAKEIRSNEEAQRWAEQVRGNISNLQTFSTSPLYPLSPLPDYYLQVWTS